ncbi:transcription factor bHLH19-like [Phragmites australis]|uniref:transcription factor bHLH19-like n=1 Tax=Phragmites australis TaxID=29695 RepID=UPI002D7680C7|nr:transcription factor bHLH19-like [Phragmites australis]
MDSSANHQWLAELENEDLGDVDLIDPLSMQQMAESLANELWNQEQQERPDQQQQCAWHTASTAGFSFVGDISKSYAEGFPTAMNAGGSSSNNNMFSFTDASRQLSFSAREPKEGIAGTAPSIMERKGGQRGSTSVHEHAIAERKRRGKMHQQFATLASIVPDTTKTDKVSVLDSTIEYVHHLRDRLKALEEEHHQSTAESPPLDSRCCIGSEDGDGGEGSPKIEADVRGTTVLLRVACREKKGVLIMVLTELEKHGLSIVNTNVVPFADSSLNITITAQVLHFLFPKSQLIQDYSNQFTCCDW